MKKTYFKRITAAVIAICMILASVAMLAPVVFAASSETAAASSADTAILPIGTGAISAEDYYRLLYFNDVSLKNIIYDFEKTGFDFTEVTYQDTYLNALKAANIGLSLLSKVENPFLSAVANIGKKIILGQKIENINVNNKKMLNQIGEQIEDVYEALSKDIENQTTILSQKMSDFAIYLSNQMESEKCIGTIKSFNESAFGGKGYGAWKKELYAGYSQLVYYNANGASAADMKEAYDQLYVTAEKYTQLVSLMTANEYAEDFSIQDAVYKYYLLKYQNNGDISPEEIVNECISFTEELYTTYIFAKTCMNICHRYQLEVLRETYGSNFATKGYVLSDSVNTLDRRVPYYSVIKPFIENHSTDINSICAEISRYYAKILNICESYNIITNGISYKVLYNQIVTDNTKTAQTVTRNGIQGSEKHVIRNNRVNKGDIIHLSSIPQKLTASFAQKYTFVSSNESIASVSASGVVTVHQDKDFSVSLMYGNSTVYTMHFKASGYFSGGMGSSESPFLISDAEDLVSLANSPEFWAKGYHFKMTDDIALNSITSIGTAEKRFYGVFDGNGYTVSGLRGNSLFGINNGTIKNLCLDNVQVTTGYVYLTRLQIGGLCSYSNGTIENVHIKNAVINVTNTAALNPSNGNGGIYRSVLLFAGGIAGQSDGIIKGSSVSGTTIKGYQTNGTASGAINEVGSPKDNTVSIGGITGYNQGAIEDCLAKNLTQYTYIKSVSSFNNYLGVKTEHLCTAYFITGGIVGTNYGNVARCASYSISESHSWEYDTHNNVLLARKKYFQEKSESISALVAKNVDNGTATLCFTPGTALSQSQQEELTSAGWTLGTNPSFKPIAPSSISVGKEPVKVLYDLNTPLNLAGLTLVTDKGEHITDGYTVTESFSDDNGKKNITVDFNGLTATFSATVLCHHNSEEVVSVKNSNDEKVICQNCGGEILYIEGSLAPTYVQHDHEYDSGVITKPASHMEDGEKTFTCVKCEEFYTESIEHIKEHKFNKKAEADKHLVSTPLCGEKAEYYYSCECGETGTETFFSAKAYAHKYGDALFNESEHWHKCSECGHTSEKEAHSFGVWKNVTEGKKERSCFDCGYVETADIEKPNGTVEGGCGGKKNNDSLLMGGGAVAMVISAVAGTRSSNKKRKNNAK